MESKTKQSDFLKLIAAATMLIDHVAVLIQGSHPTLYLVMRMIGRISFPIYSYYIAQGFFYTRSLSKYVRRLALWALISQVPYMLYFNNFMKLNVLFTFLLSILALYALKKRWMFTVFGVALVPVCTQILFNLSFDYSFYGVLLPVIFYYFKDEHKRTAGAFALLGMIYCVTLGSALSNPRTYLQMLSVISLPIIFYLYDKVQLKLNKYFFYSFYPLHLGILYIVKLLLR